MNDPVGTIDFESRSACSIKNCGSWRYSLDPTTEVLCLAFRLPDYPDDYVDLWHPAFPHLGIEEEGQEGLVGLFDYILHGGLVEAHNAFFERGIWTNICGPRLGWPLVQPHQWRCSAAKAAAHALPRDLDGALDALNLNVSKDEAGHKVMKKMSKPRKSRKAEREAWLKFHSTLTDMPLLWWESPQLFNTLWVYCMQDVRAESILSCALDDLSPEETQMYLIDQAVNQRGFQLDTTAITTALALISREESILLEEFRHLTGGSIKSPKQRIKLKAWLVDRGMPLPNTQKATIDDILQSPYWMEGADSDVKRILEILRQLGASSTAKYQKMADWVCPDGRAHGGMLYHGASTGRWSGAGIQPHNFPKGDVKKVAKDMEGAWSILLKGDRDDIQATLGAPVMACLASALRGGIVASPGKRLFVADYAGIEARVLLWLAQDDKALSVFHRGEDIYCEMASAIYGYPCNKQDHPQERAIGKIAVLGLGYQMGVGKFVDTAATGGVTITEDFSQQVVDAYRTKFWRVKQMWYDQERAAIEATVNPGEDIVCGRMVWNHTIDEEKGTAFLYCYLPSGRRLAYARPQVKVMENRWGSLKDTLSFYAVDPKIKQWRRQTTYGGMIVENQTQAVARDIMAHALRLCEASKVYEPVLTVHDEIVCEAHPLIGNVREFERLLTDTPSWAENCPIAAEGFSAIRYHK